MWHAWTFVFIFIVSELIIFKELARVNFVFIKLCSKGFLNSFHPRDCLKCYIWTTLQTSIACRNHFSSKHVEIVNILIIASWKCFKTWAKYSSVSMFGDTLQKTYLYVLLIHLLLLLYEIFVIMYTITLY